MSSATFILNGQRVPLEPLPSDTTLLEHLRARGLVGTKEGCGDGDCGACTVAVVGTGSQGGARYEAINSCLLPLATLADREVLTVEGLAGGRGGERRGTLHPVQVAMVAAGGSQCGYCTPGFVMSLFAAYYEGALSEGTVSHDAIGGNLCRCTGYLPIRRAMATLEPPAPNDPFRARLAAHTAPEPATQRETQPQDPDRRVFLPRTLAEAFALLERYPEAKLIAGGTDLGLELSHKRLEDPLLVSLERVAELRRLEVVEDAITIGAGLPLSQLQAGLRARLAGVFPALEAMLEQFAARQVRNRATLGGNLGTASPIGDLSPVLLALDAQVLLASAGGERSVSAAAFFTGYRQSARRPGEVIVGARLPRPEPSSLSAAYKVSKRQSDDISVVAAAFALRFEGGVGKNPAIASARLAYGGVAPTPLRALEVEGWLLGRPWTDATVEGALPRLRAAFEPISDLRASAEYRRALVANLFLRFFEDSRHL